MYLNADGMPQDDTKAVEYFSMAADADDPVAMLRLSVMYSEGRGIRKNIDQSQLWLKQAANAGNEDAARLLKQDAATTQPTSP